MLRRQGLLTLRLGRGSGFIGFGFARNPRVVEREARAVVRVRIVRRRALGCCNRQQRPGGASDARARHLETSTRLDVSAIPYERAAMLTDWA
jgi:hypothetical protein